jgi:hypothetical protein
MGRKSTPGIERENMKTKPLSEDVDALVGLAEGIATVLSQKRDDLGISTDVEALLRASIAAATFGINTYIAVLAGATKSPLATSFVATAKTRCDRNIEHLRRRVTRSITELCRLMDDEDLLEVAEYVVSISS